MKTPHKHAELIKAWADGAEIEAWSNKKQEWISIINAPIWMDDIEYRVKPELKPDIVRMYCVNASHDSLSTLAHEYSNLVLTFDGETRQLKSAKVI